MTDFVIRAITNKPVVVIDHATETDYIGGSIYSFYLSGEQYGYDLTPSLSLNTSIAF